jgi:hypothetical protein
MKIGRFKYNIYPVSNKMKRYKAIHDDWAGKYVLCEVEDNHFWVLMKVKSASRKLLIGSPLHYDEAFEIFGNLFNDKKTVIWYAIMKGGYFVFKNKKEAEAFAVARLL